MNRTQRWRSALTFGFISLLICGVGDWLIGYEPQGGEEILFGISNTRITEVPAWFYILSMVMGILSGFACQRYAPVMMEILDDKGIDRNGRMYRLFHFGLSSAPMMFVSFHVVCCVSLLYMQAALAEGLTMEGLNRSFMLPVVASLLPFLVWCMLVDIPCTAAYMHFVWTGQLGLPKSMVVLCPLDLSLLTKLGMAIMLALGLDRFVFLMACGESWGWAFMCLAFRRSIAGKK